MSVAKKSEVAAVGRPSAFAGKQLWSLCDSNPRRTGTHGHESHAIIRKKPGITYEEFVSKGGRAMDLRWDINSGFVTTRKPRR